MMESDKQPLVISIGEDHVLCPFLSELQSFGIFIAHLPGYNTIFCVLCTIAYKLQVDFLW